MSLNPSCRLAYRCEPMLGAKGGELAWTSETSETSETWSFEDFEGFHRFPVGDETMWNTSHTLSRCSRGFDHRLQEAAGRQLVELKILLYLLWFRWDFHFCKPCKSMTRQCAGDFPVVISIWTWQVTGMAKQQMKIDDVLLVYLKESDEISFEWLPLWLLLAQVEPLEMHWLEELRSWALGQMAGAQCEIAMRKQCERVRFRAFFLYHYWPCAMLSSNLESLNSFGEMSEGDKSIFQMYMHEPIDICLLSAKHD